MLTESGELCEAACLRNGLSCFGTPSTDMLNQLNSKTALRALLTETGIAGGGDSYCNVGANGGGRGFAMAEKGGGQTCYYIGASESYRTDIYTFAGWQAHYRLCPCSKHLFVEGTDRTPLCPNGYKQATVDQCLEGVQYLIDTTSSSSRVWQSVTSLRSWASSWDPSGCVVYLYNGEWHHFFNSGGSSTGQQSNRLPVCALFDETANPTTSNPTTSNPTSANPTTAIPTADSLHDINGSCEISGDITHLDWDNLMDGTELKPSLSYTMDIDPASLTLHIEIDLKYLGWSYSDDHTPGLGVSYVIDFEVSIQCVSVSYLHLIYAITRVQDYDAERDDFRFPGNCQNRVASDFVDVGFNNMWGYSADPTDPGQIGAAPYLAYPPPPDGLWNLSITPDCGPLHYQGELRKIK